MFVGTKTTIYRGQSATLDLSRDLADMSKNTKLLKITDPVLCRFDSAGRLGGKFTMTRLAVQELGGLIAKNLGSAWVDLADKVSRPEEIAMVAESMNNLSSLRFAGIMGWRWVLDTADNTVAGIVGSRYKVTRNLDFWTRIEQTCLGEADKPKLFTAILHGRNLDIVMAGRDTVDICGTVFSRGVLAQNAETSGRAVRASNVLISQADMSWACDNFYPDTRIPHLKGRKFDERLSQIYGRLRQRRLKKDDLQAAWTKAANTRLTKDGVDVKTSIGNISTVLRRYGLSMADSKEAAMDLVSRYKTPRMSDLLQVLGKRASGRNDGNAIKCRQLVYSLCFIGSKNGSGKD